MRSLKMAIVSLSSLWFGMTAAVDFVAVPLVFTTLSSLEQAGKLGMAVFGRFNTIEMFISTLILALSFMLFAKQRNGKWGATWLLLSILVAALALIYSFYLTPMIGFLAREMHQFPLESEPYLKVYEQHQFFHKLYVKLDSVKLLSLLVLIISMAKNLCKKEEAV